MAKRRPRGLRDLLVWLHVVTSLGWMSQALALSVLVLSGATAGTPTLRSSAYSLAEVLDGQVLLYMANSSAFTGLMLCGLTAWGYFRHWWVLAKFVITLSQLYLGIFLLSPRLAALAEGHGGSPGVQVAGSLLMASAIAFQAWLSIAKPWKRTPWTRTGQPSTPSGSASMFAFALAVPVADYLLGAHVLGHPLPLLPLLTVVAYPVWRARAGRVRPA
ncbi:hypothetical protein IL992_34870 [Microbispora sp. NEAU-D428]|uniref:hypothetical protein n=1 Tax=Microbispora sitophila TaxID=2771537 RepID=UPI001866DB32|nr:hypothetical protein [Microbispora sitophila]MBE3014320.1 hypothetical protein [Microbispora sitophila]